VQNAFIESFNGRLRDECLNQHHFLGLDDARALIEDWRQDYDEIRPYTSLGGQTPEGFLLGLAGGMPPARPKPHRQLNLFEETQQTPGRS
jgi:transposase InsO family protein